VQKNGTIYTDFAPTVELLSEPLQLLLPTFRDAFAMNSQRARSCKVVGPGRRRRMFCFRCINPDCWQSRTQRSPTFSMTLYDRLTGPQAFGFDSLLHRQREDPHTIDKDRNPQRSFPRCGHLNYLICRSVPRLSISTSHLHSGTQQSAPR
jgi:hypothetical protein